MINDPVAAYDRIAPYYSKLAARRSAYLRAVERRIIESIPQGSASMLDVGAGDGTRAFRIAGATGIQRLILAEPSTAMRTLWPAGTIAWDTRAENLAQREVSFDVVTCLWNVLGHVGAGRADAQRQRREALRQMMRLLRTNGAAFIDVNHRYNARHYGACRTAGRFFCDLLIPGSTHGDVTAEWEIFGERTRTYGHVFTHREFKKLCADAGALIERRFVLDYETGAEQRWAFRGNLLYQLRPSKV